MNPATENHISNYYLLQRLAEKLTEELTGLALKQCLSTGKNEIIFTFSATEKTIYVKANFEGESLLYLPGHEVKPGKNQRPYFDTILGTTVSAVQAHPQDRSFRLIFETGYNLVFMMYGQNSNIILFKGNEQVELFRHRFEKHKELRLADFDKYKAPDFSHYEKIASVMPPAKAIKQLFPGLSGRMLQYLEKHDIAEKNIIGQWEQVKNLEQLLLTGPMDIMETGTENGNSITLNLLPFGDEENLLLSTADVFEAENLYANKYLYLRHFQELKKASLGTLHAKIARAAKQLASARETLNHLRSDRDYKKQADVIMANLHAIPAGAERIMLYDFYIDKEAEFIFKRGISPQSHAEKLYRKAKNQEIEKQKSEERITVLETEMQNLETELKRISAVDDWKELKATTKTIEKETREGTAPPFRHFSFDGFDIYVGKSAANNDKLSFGFAHKNDLWLHARDVSGSHVIIKHKPSHVFPQPVIEKAAGIAAYYSRNKGSILSPVIYTLIKYVRKPKGAAPGAVICEKEKMVMAAPKIG